VVEDDPAVLQVLRLFLDHAGYRTIAAASADAATRSMREHELHAVVFDLSVVRADPAARLRAWRAERAGTPFILCTAWDPGRLTTLFGEDPPDGFVPKPFTGAQLHAELGRAVRLRREAEVAAGQKPHVQALARSGRMLRSAI
jgi:DNA-binding response OmpR family regulator